MTSRARKTERIAGIASALERARRRGASPDFIGEAELYCENPGCSIRQVVLALKELDGPTPASLRCPACREPLKVHQVFTLAEQRVDDERWARCSVNVQRYERDHPGEFGVPIGVLLNDRLLA